MSARRPDLLHDPVGRALRGLSLPFGLGIVFIIAINLADTYFVGLLGTAELAVMSFTFPVVTLVISVAMGLGIGTTSAVSRAIGAGDTQKVRRLTTHGLMLAALVVTVLSVIGLLTQDMVFRALGADESLLPLLDEFMTVWYLGAVFLVVPMVGTSAIRATGDAKAPMYIMMVAAIANIVLDPLFIFGAGPIPAMGLRGAALATVAARSVTLAAALWILIKRENMIELHWPTWAELRPSWKAIASVGAPAAVTNAVVPVATAVLTWLIAKHGAEAVAAYGVASRVEGLLMIAPMALSGSLAPFIGQNWGAHHTERVAAAIVLARNFVVAWGAGAWVILALGGSVVAEVFSEDPLVIEYVHLYLWIVPLSYGANGLVWVASAAFNAVDKAVRSTVLASLRSLVLAIPLAVIGSAVAGLAGIFSGLAAAAILAAGVAYVWMRRLTLPVARRKEARKWEAKAPELTQVVERVIDAIDDLDDVEVHPVRGRSLGFFVGERELGHVHRQGHVDVAFPPEVRDALVAEGHAEHHRTHHDSAWVTHTLHTSEDVEAAVWLLHLAHAFARLARHGRDHDAAEKELDALKLSESLRARVEAAAQRLPTKAAA